MDKEYTISYTWKDTAAPHTHAFLWKPVLQCLRAVPHTRIFDLGCGNGAFARHLGSLGYEVKGCDPSEEGIQQARTADPSMHLDVGSAYEPLSEHYGTFPLLVSLEVVEHVYYPRKYAKCVYNLLESGGIAVISTPYHGYLKNLALALTGAMDRHFTALWDHGHIKFWSVKTLGQLFEEQGMKCEKVLRVGRIPVLGMSMILVFRKP